jgi:hypothetical protein
VTSFQFAGGGPAASPPDGPSEFGSIVPLPGVPTSVERGGDWTLQRLAREVAPPPRRFQLSNAKAAAAPTDGVQVLLQTRIDALDLTVLRGGGRAVGDWAREHGFLLTPDAPEVLDFYAKRSPVFLAARYDAAAARAKGLAAGDGTPIHLTIPLDNPWVPLRILTLGRGALEPVSADVFLLTDKRPALLPGPNTVMTLDRSQAASSSLLSDLRSDKGMGWVSQNMWLTYLRINTTSSHLQNDLAIDTTGRGRPSAVLAGGVAPAPAHSGSTSTLPMWVLAGLLLTGTAIAVLFIARRSG